MDVKKQTEMEPVKKNSPFVPPIIAEVKPTLLHGSHSEFERSTSDSPTTFSETSIAVPYSSSEAGMQFYADNIPLSEGYTYDDLDNQDQMYTSSFVGNNKLSDDDLKTAKYITSFRGNRLVACKDYIYRRKMSRAGKTYWSCIRNHCTAKLHVVTGSDPPMVLNQHGEHTHLADYGATVAREALNM